MRRGLLVPKPSSLATNAAAISSFENPPPPSTTLHRTDARGFLETNPGLSSMFAVVPSSSRNGMAKPRRPTWPSWLSRLGRHHSHNHTITPMPLPTPSLAPQLDINRAISDSGDIDTNGTYCAATMCVPELGSNPFYLYLTLV